MTEKELRDFLISKMRDMYCLGLDDAIKKRFTPSISIDVFTTGIMARIKESCWLKGEQGLPKNPATSDAKNRIIGAEIYEGIYDDGQRDIVEAGFKPCQEWEK